jgi:hypothetical protein
MLAKSQVARFNEVLILARINVTSDLETRQCRPSVICGDSV